MRLLRSHWGFVLLAALAAALLAAFCIQGGVASMADDSVSYLVLARHFAGTSQPHIAPWVPLHAHFGPLLPLFLAMSGGAENGLVAHGVVAAFALLSLVAVYAVGIAEGRGRLAGIALCVTFLATPTAWISVKGILSESLFMAITLAAVLFALRRPPAAWRPPQAIVFGLLLGAAYLARSAGVALIAAFAAQLAWAALAARRAPSPRLLAPFAVAALCATAWWLVRPSGPIDGYRHTAEAMLAAWRDHPGLMLAMDAQGLWEGWRQTFVGAVQTPASTDAALALLAALAIAGAALRAWANRLDGWYVLATLGMLGAWVFDGENMRRLLYPVLPLVLLHAAIAVAAACRATGRTAWSRPAVMTTAALAMLLAAPATLLIARKAADREPLPGLGIPLSAITEDYRVVNIADARVFAAKHAGVIGGLQLVGRVTAPDARILWARPEYVAVLAGRAGVPLLHRWDAPALAAAASDSGATHVIASGLTKTDHEHLRGDGYAPRRLAAPFTEPVLVVPNAVNGLEELVLLRIDPVKLRAYLDAVQAGPNTK